MEELQRLEQMQCVLDCLESRGSSISDSDHDSNCFLVNFIRFLTQPCGELDIRKKCSLIADFMPRISIDFLEEKSRRFNKEEQIMEQGDRQSLQECTLQLNTNLNKDCEMFQDGFVEMPKVGLEAMEHANSTLEDFAFRFYLNNIKSQRSYFVFHGLDVNRPQTLFKYLPVLSFVESYIYQLDKMNEKLVHIPVILGGKAEMQEATRLDARFFGTQVRSFLNLLESRGFLTDRIREEFKNGENYWALERKLCCAISESEEILIDEVMMAIHLKSFDYRVMNLLLYHLRGEKVDELHMEFLSISEFLVEVSDDLFDYEVDVLENNFNILRMLIRVYGASTAPIMLARYITEAEEKYDRLFKSLDPQLSESYRQRCEEATKEGGKVSGYPLGTWNIPNVIVDEDLYRSQLIGC